MERVPGNKGNVAVRRWLKKVGAGRAKEICVKAGIGYEHLKHVGAGRRA